MVPVGGVAIAQAAPHGAPSLADIIAWFAPDPLPEPIIARLCGILLRAASEGVTASARDDGGIQPGALFLVADSREAGQGVRLHLVSASFRRAPCAAAAAVWQGAPELQSQPLRQPATEAADVWSIGMIAAECALGVGVGGFDHEQYKPALATLLGRLERAGMRASDAEPVRLSLEQPVCSTALSSFLSLSLLEKPADRASAETLLRHPLVQGQPQGLEGGLWLGGDECPRGQRLQLELGGETAVACAH